MFERGEATKAASRPIVIELLANLRAGGGEQCRDPARSAAREQENATPCNVLSA